MRVEITSTERMVPSGGWLVSGFMGGVLFTRRYFGYSKREAQQMFRAEMRGQ